MRNKSGALDNAEKETESQIYNEERKRNEENMS